MEKRWRWCCRCPGNRYEPVDASHRSLLYKILEAKLFDCLRNHPSSDSLSGFPSPHLMKSQVSNIDPIEEKSTPKHMEMSTLAVPKSKKSRKSPSKKSKKKRRT